MVRMVGDGLNTEIIGDLPIFWGLFKIKKALKISGFYATRYVNAEHAELAVSSIRSSILKDLAEELHQYFDKPSDLKLEIDEIAIVDDKDVDINAKGFTFF